MDGGNFAKFLIRNLASKTLPVCLLSLYMSRNNVRIWMVKFVKPPVIHQICQSFPPPKISVYYMHTNPYKTGKQPCTKQWMHLTDKQIQLISSKCEELKEVASKQRLNQ